MLGVGGSLPELAGPGSHRRSKSDCGLNLRDKANDLAPLEADGLGGGGRADHGHHHHTRPTTPVAARPPMIPRSPSTSSIPEIFISSEEEGPGVSPVTRLAVFSLADFLETISHAQGHHRHHHHRPR